jgi:hypothetical protein
LLRRPRDKTCWSESLAGKAEDAHEVQRAESGKPVRRGFDGHADGFEVAWVVVDQGMPATSAVAAIRMSQRQRKSRSWRDSTDRCVRFGGAGGCRSPVRRIPVDRQGVAAHPFHHGDRRDVLRMILRVALHPATHIRIVDRSSQYSALVSNSNGPRAGLSKSIRPSAP